VLLSSAKINDYDAPPFPIPQNSPHKSPQIVDNASPEAAAIAPAFGFNAQQQQQQHHRISSSNTHFSWRFRDSGHRLQQGIISQVGYPSALIKLPIIWAAVWVAAALDDVAAASATSRVVNGQLPPGRRQNLTNLERLYGWIAAAGSMQSQEKPFFL